MPGEPAEPIELGLGAPSTGLYLREDVDLRCNIFMAGFVKKTIKKSHSTLVDRLHELARKLAKNGASTGVQKDKILPSFAWQRDNNIQGHGRNASSPTLTSGVSPFHDRPLPPTPPAELDDAKVLPSYHPFGQQPQAAELQ